MLPDSFSNHFRRAFADLVGARLLVALSGGADSVALLHLLSRPELRLRLCAAHVHHGVRGRDADADAAFCDQLCRSLSIPLTTQHIRIDSHPREGLEAAWRRARYQALFRAADEHEAAAVATAHHQDDIAEGVLVQLLRGAGPRALAGISPRAGLLVRPLLPWSHAALLDYLRSAELTWREDRSNLDLQHLRNRVRHEILPELEATSPRLRRHLCRLASALADDEDFFARRLEAEAPWIDPYDPEGGVPSVTIATFPTALRTRWLHAQAARLGIGRVTHRQGELFGHLLEGKLGAVTLNGRWVLRHARRRLWLEPPAKIPPYHLELAAEATAELPFPGWTISLQRAPATTGSASRWRTLLSEPDGIVVRSQLPGDTLPDGARLCQVFKKDLPRHLRRAWPILVKDDKIQWIPGFGVTTCHGGTGAWMVEVMRT